jgi:multiple sugar transport system permease protein
VVLQFLLGLGTALVLNENFRGRTFTRAAIIIPWVTPPIVSGLMWAWIYHPYYGVLSDIMKRLGLVKEPIPWLVNPDLALHSVVLVQAWAGFPFFAVVLLAGMQSIPKVMYESASIDGAGPLQRFLRITWPLLRGPIVVSTTLRVIWTIKYVDIIYILTGGGPANATQTLALYTFQNFLGRLDIGYSSTLGTILTVIITSFAIVYTMRFKVI